MAEPSGELARNAEQKLLGTEKRSREKENGRSMVLVSSGGRALRGS